jgi:hypothetical protein
VSKGADVNAQGGFYGNALQAASSGGHERIIELLVRKDADSKAQGGVYSFRASPMTSANYIQSNDLPESAVKKIAQVLLEHSVLRQLCEEAINSSTVGLGRFKRTFRRIVRQYGDTLLWASQRQQEIDCANFIKEQARLLAIQFCIYIQEGP